MIDFSDKTMKESYGNFTSVKELMKIDGSEEWMIETDTMVRNDILSCFYVLHLYNSGEVKIIKTNHPIDLEIPDDDIRELSSWCYKNGWSGLTVHSGLIDDIKDFNFWMRQFRAGNVKGRVFEEYEKSESERFAIEREKENIEDGD